MDNSAFYVGERRTKGEREYFIAALHRSLSYLEHNDDVRRLYFYK